MAVGFVLISTEPGREVEVRDKVAKLANVSGQWIVFGIHGSEYATRIGIHVYICVCVIEIERDREKERVIKLINLND